MSAGAVEFQQVAQVEEGGTISEIRVVGIERIEPETVRSYLTVHPGDPFSNAALDNALKTLFATGLFADVTMRRDGDALVVRVVENPVINAVSFEGNKHFDTDKLNDEVQLRPRTVYTRTRVQADVKRLIDLYRRSGRFGATVDPKVVQLPQNRVDVVFEIHEGSPTKIDSINFIGNKAFDNDELQAVISTRESRWYRLFSSSDTYDPDRLSYDRELLRKFYLAHGYVDFHVTSAVAELTPDRRAFVITFQVDEGDRFKFGKADVKVSLPHVSAADLQPLITITPGDWYNADLIESTTTALTNALGDRGYAFVDIEPQQRRVAGAEKTIDITFNVAEAPRVYVERIDVTGNIRTLDKVIRREITLAEGDAFSTSKIKRSEQNLNNLGYFKKVEVTNAPGSAPDKTIVTAKVEEQSTGSLSVGAGFSSGYGLLGSVSVHESNFLGRGQDLVLSGELAQYLSLYQFSFTEPYFLDRPIAAGFDLFSQVLNANQDIGNNINNYYLESLGATLRAGFQLSPDLRATYSYTLRDDKVSNISSAASVYIQQSAGSRTALVFAQDILYDKRDNRLTPSSGYYLSSGTSLAGGGGNVEFVKQVFGGGYYISLWPSWVLGSTVEFGAINGLGYPVALQDRFFLGGDTLRGFADQGVGPHDSNTGDALGGNYYYRGSFELTLPTGLPEDYGISARTFIDYGSLFSIDTPEIAGHPITDSPAIRVAAGIGVSWKSPFGPIGVDVGVPVKKVQHDQTEVFRINFGTRF